MPNTIYPNAVDTSLSLPLVIDQISEISADVINRLRSAIIAIESELGADPSREFGTVRARLDNLNSLINNLETSFQEIITGAATGQVLVNNSDSVLGFLEEKVLAGSNISLAVVGNQLEITANVVSDSNKAKVSSDDSSENFLESKLIAGSGVSLTVLDPGGNEQISIASTIVDANKLKASSTDLLENFLVDKITPGNNLSLTTINPSGNEIIRLDAYVGFATTSDKNRNPSDTTGDGYYSGLTITSLPYSDSFVQVFVNGILIRVGDGIKTHEAFFSGNLGVSARNISDIISGDRFYWNGVIAGYNLSSSDYVSFIYEKIQT